MKSPAHYERLEVQPIEVAEQLSFNLGNVVKYVARAGHKNGEDLDRELDKAVWYIERERQRLHKQQRKTGKWRLSWRRKRNK